jgi:3-oxoacyl-[acyl-carrier protein] reductase
LMASRARTCSTLTCLYWAGSRLVAIAPGAINTARDMSQYAHVNVEQVLARLAIKHPGDSDDIAEACLYLAGDSGKYVTGQVIHVNGGLFMG